MASKRAEMETLGAPFSTCRMVLTALFILAMIVGATLSPKVVLVAGYAVPGGIFVFPLTYVIVTIMAECYGAVVAWRLIFIGTACLTLAWVCFTLVELAPSAPCCVATGSTFNHMYQADGLSILVIDGAFLLAQGASLWTFRLLKRRSNGNRLLWMRYCGSPMMAQILVVLIASPFTLNKMGVHGLLVFLQLRVVIAVSFSCLMVPVIHASVLFIRLTERPRPSSLKGPF